MFFWLSGFGVPDRPLLPASHLILRWSSGLSLWEAVAFIAHASSALSPGFGGEVASFRWLCLIVDSSPSLLHRRFKSFTSSSTLDFIL